MRRILLLCLLLMAKDVRCLSNNAFTSKAPSLPATTLTRDSFISLLSLWSVSSALPANSFEGGVGGLGKTRPQTGVVFFPGSEPLQQGGQVSAELVLGKKNVLVGFDTPWPLLPTTAGLEARNLQTSESSFVHVIENRSQPTSASSFKNLLLETVLSSKGKFGAYGTPTDVKVKQLEQKDSASGGVLLYSTTFTTMTPGQRESERQVYINPIAVDQNNLVLLVSGTTKLRFKSEEAQMRRISESFTAVLAPQSNLSSR